MQRNMDRFVPSGKIRPQADKKTFLQVAADGGNPGRKIGIGLGAVSHEYSLFLHPQDFFPG